MSWTNVASDSRMGSVGDTLAIAWQIPVDITLCRRTFGKSGHCVRVWPSPVERGLTGVYWATLHVSRYPHEIRAGEGQEGGDHK